MEARIQSILDTPAKERIFLLQLTDASPSLQWYLLEIDLGGIWKPMDSKWQWCRVFGHPVARTNPIELLLDLVSTLFRAPTARPVPEWFKRALPNAHTSAWEAPTNREFLRHVLLESMQHQYKVFYANLLAKEAQDAAASDAPPPPEAVRPTGPPPSFKFHFEKYRNRRGKLSVFPGKLIIPLPPGLALPMLGLCQMGPTESAWKLAQFRWQHSGITTDPFRTLLGLVSDVSASARNARISLPVAPEADTLPDGRPCPPRPPPSPAASPALQPFDSPRVLVPSESYLVPQPIVDEPDEVKATLDSAEPRAAVYVFLRPDDPYAAQGRLALAEFRGHVETKPLKGDEANSLSMPNDPSIFIRFTTCPTPGQTARPPGCGLSVAVRSSQRDVREFTRIFDSDRMEGFSEGPPWNPDLAKHSSGPSMDDMFPPEAMGNSGRSADLDAVRARSPDPGNIPDRFIGWSCLHADIEVVKPPGKGKGRSKRKR